MGIQYILLKVEWFKSEEGTLGCLFFIYYNRSLSQYVYILDALKSKTTVWVFKKKEGEQK